MHLRCPGPYSEQSFSHSNTRVYSQYTKSYVKLMKITLEKYENFPMFRLQIFLINFLQPIPVLSVEWIASFPLDATYTHMRTVRETLVESH